MTCRLTVVQRASFCVFHHEAHLQQEHRSWETRKQRHAGLHEQGWCQHGTTVTHRDLHVYLPDCDRSRTASQCWGDLLARAAGAEDKRKKYFLFILRTFCKEPLEWLCLSDCFYKTWGKTLLRQYLNDEGFPLRFALDGLNCNIFAFPLGFAHDPKRSSSHHLKNQQLLLNFPLRRWSCCPTSLQHQQSFIKRTWQQKQSAPTSSTSISS